MLRHNVVTRFVLPLDILFHFPCFFSFQSSTQSCGNPFISTLFLLNSPAFHIPSFSKVFHSGRSRVVFCQRKCTTSCHGAKESKLKLTMVAPYFPDDFFTILGSENDVESPTWTFTKIYSPRIRFLRGKKTYTAGRSKTLKNSRFVRFRNGSISEPVPKKKTAGSCNYGGATRITRT